ncbi:MAG: hypothetical protein AB7F59_08140 [Bdellovibrionales bacterium]
MEKTKLWLQKQLEVFSGFLSTTRGLMILLGILAVFSLLREWRGREASPTTTKSPSATADTYIPNGFVLVPIEIQNIEGLDSILGQFGVVDLFLPSVDGQGRGKLIARRLKILRAPLNPSHFAILAPENQAPEIVKYSGPFFVVIQNPNESGTRFVKEKVRSSRISFDQIIE